MHTFRQLPPAEQTPPEFIAAVPVIAPRAALADAPDESVVAPFLEAAENAEQERRRKWLVAKTGFACYAAAHLFSAAVLLLHPAHRASWITGAMISGYAALFTALTFLPKTRAKQKEAVAALLRFPPAPRVLLPLIDAATLPQTEEEQSVLYPALTEILWNLPASEAALRLDETRRAALRAIVRQAKRRQTPGRRTLSYIDLDEATADLAVAAMKTLVQIGDVKTVKILKKIIKTETRRPNEIVVRDAAREYLPALQQKITETEAVQRKLRVCLGEKIRDPQKVLAEYLDTLAPEEAKVALVTFLEGKRHNLSYLPSMGDIVVWLGIGFIVFRGNAADWKIFPLIISLLLVLNVISTALFRVIFSEVFGNNRNRRMAAFELARRSESDTRLISALLNCTKRVSFQSSTTRDDTVKKALVRLLPHIKPGDAALVPPAERAYLRLWLTSPRRTRRDANASQTLTIIALNALAALGDTRALPQAGKIARRTVGGTHRETELHEAALRCVKALQKR